MKEENFKKQEAITLAQRYSLEEEKAYELVNLLSEMRPLNFTNSKQLSNYVVKQKLGYKYPNISGNLRMKEGSEEWNFQGGFSKEIYHVICKELNLVNEGSDAKPIKFTSFNDFKKALPPSPYPPQFLK